MKGSNAYDGTLIYLYGLLPEEELKDFPHFIGVDGIHSSYFIQSKNIVAVVSDVDEEEFSQESIDKNLQNPSWLEEKGSIHHKLISLLNNEYTIIPMSLCTIFKDKENLINTISNLEADVMKLFIELNETEEWNIKVYSDENKLKNSIKDNNKSVIGLEQELQIASKGKQFFLKKKLENVVNDEIEKEKKRISEQINFVLKDITNQYKLNKIWPKKLTGRDDEMIVNTSYLISNTSKESFFIKLKELKENYNEKGLIIEHSGPWPPYHFASLKKEE